MNPVTCDALVGAFAALNAGDFLTTWLALRRGATEKNPVVARWPVTTGIAKVAAVAVVVVKHRAFYGSAVLQPSLALVVGVSAFVVAKNVWVILALREDAQ